MAQALQMVQIRSCAQHAEGSAKLPRIKDLLAFVGHVQPVTVLESQLKILVLSAKGKEG